MMSSISSVTAASKFSGTAIGLFQAHDIFIADVAAVFAQVESDDVGPTLDGQQGSRHRVRETPAARIAQGRDVVDVDAQQRGIEGGQLGA